MAGTVALLGAGAMTQEIVEHISTNSGRLLLAVTCIGVGVVMGLGINKDLEPLARRVKKLGGAVEITRRAATTSGGSFLMGRCFAPA